MTKAKEKEPENIKYLVKTRTDDYMIEVPRNWKITFASVNPASGGGRGGDAYCLRVYEMPGNALRAVFDSVIAVRDQSIPLARRIKSEVGQSSWSHDSLGNFKEAREVKVDEKLQLENPFELE